jgi:hypothetical protein
VSSEGIYGKDKVSPKWIRPVAHWRVYLWFYPRFLFCFVFCFFFFFFVPFDLFSTSFLSLISFSTIEIMNIQLYIVHQFLIFYLFIDLFVIKLIQ